MKNIFWTLTVTVSFVFMGCGNKNQEVSQEEIEVVAHEHEDHDHDHDHHNKDIELNNGAKWIVNEEMKPFIQKGSEIVNTFEATGIADFRTLAQKLKEQNNHLISSCTMEGKSHDELHKWLHPHIELIKELEESKDIEEAQEIVREIQKSYETYKEYFQ